VYHTVGASSSSQTKNPAVTPRPAPRCRPRLASLHVDSHDQVDVSLGRGLSGDAGCGAENLCSDHKCRRKKDNNTAYAQGGSYDCQAVQHVLARPPAHVQVSKCADDMHITACKPADACGRCDQTTEENAVMVTAEGPTARTTVAGGARLSMPSKQASVHQHAMITVQLQSFNPNRSTCRARTA
jgi:hypothetical protein